MPQFIRIYGSEEFGSDAPRDGDEGAHSLLQAFARQAGAIAVAVALTSTLVAAQARGYSDSNEEIATPQPYLQEDNGPPSPVIIEPPRPWSGWNEDFPGYDPYEEDGPRLVIEFKEPPRPYLAFENEELPQQPAVVGGGGGISREPVKLIVRYSGEELVPVPVADGEQETDWRPALVVLPPIVVPSVSPHTDEIGTAAAPVVADEEQAGARTTLGTWHVVQARLWGEDEFGQQQASVLEEDDWRVQRVIPPENNAVLFLGDEGRGFTASPEEDYPPRLSSIPWPIVRPKHVDEEWVPAVPVFEDDQPLRLYSVPAPVRLRDTVGDPEEWVPFFTPTMADEPGPVLFSVAPRVVLPPAPFDEETVPFAPVLDESQWVAQPIALPSNNAAPLFNEELPFPTVSEEDQPPVLFSVRAPIVLPTFVDEEWVIAVPVFEEGDWAPPLVVQSRAQFPVIHTEELASEGNAVVDEDNWAPPLVVRPPVNFRVIQDEGFDLPIQSAFQPLRVVDRSRAFLGVTSRSRPFYDVTDRSW